MCEKTSGLVFDVAFLPVVGFDVVFGTAGRGRGGRLIGHDNAVEVCDLVVAVLISEPLRVRTDPVGAGRSIFR